MSQPALTIASLLSDPRLERTCRQWLKGGRYQLENLGSKVTPLQELEERRDTFDVVLVQQGAYAPEIYEGLRRQGLILPAVVVGEVSGRIEYHEAEVHLPEDQLEQITYSVDAAVSRFLRQGPQAGSAGESAAASSGGVATPENWRLPNRLKGRLGYLGVFYKRDPSLFLRSLPQGERQELLASLERSYRDLLISYFKDPAAANQAIESFVHSAFFSDLPVNKVVEIHVDLIDGFWKQLKLEGHKNDFLQDYRLALLDVLAHLCEMYRRSVPPDLPLPGPGSGSGAEPSQATAAANQDYAQEVN
jgi:circadian clock protein KaiA